MFQNLSYLLTHNYITRGFWGDEAWTAVISQLSIPEIIQVTGQDFHPPLYYLFVHGFIALFGNSEWIRVISTIFFAISLPLTYQLAKKLAGKTVAWVSTLLVAFSPILLIYAFEARSYGMLTMMSVASTLFFYNALETKQIKWWLAYAILGGFGVYTHYYLWFILASHGFYWLAINRKQLGRVFVSYLFIFLAQLPWIPTLLSQVQEVAGDYWIGAMNERTHWEYFFRVVAGDFTTSWQIPVAIGVLAATLLSLVIMLKQPKKERQLYWLLWFWWLVPVLLPTLISFYRPVFFYRYLVFTSVPIIIIMVWGTTKIRREIAYLLGAVLLFFYLKTNYGIFNRYPWSVREEVAEISSTATPPSSEVPIYTYLPSFAEVYFYGANVAPIKVVPEGLVQFSGRSLLDKHVEKGLVEIKELPADEVYWEIEPGPVSTYSAGIN